MATYPPVKQKPVKYIAVVETDTHSKLLGYLLWFLFGLVGIHRFYYGRPISGAIWFFTVGLLGIGWIVDAFLIPGMDDEADERFEPGHLDYNLCWVFLIVFGLFGIHRFYQGKVITGILYLLTGGLFMIGYVYDLLTLNDQISEQNLNDRSQVAVY